MAGSNPKDTKYPTLAKEVAGNVARIWLAKNVSTTKYHTTKNKPTALGSTLAVERFRDPHTTSFKMETSIDLIKALPERASGPVTELATEPDHDHYR